MPGVPVSLTIIGRVLEIQDLPVQVDKHWEKELKKAELQHGEMTRVTCHL